MPFTEKDLDALSYLIKNGMPKPKHPWDLEQVLQSISSLENIKVKAQKQTPLFDTHPFVMGVYAQAKIVTAEALDFLLPLSNVFVDMLCKVYHHTECPTEITRDTLFWPILPSTQERIAALQTLTDEEEYGVLLGQLTSEFHIHCQMYETAKALLTSYQQLNTLKSFCKDPYNKDILKRIFPAEIMDLVEDNPPEPTFEKMFDDTFQAIMAGIPGSSSKTSG